MFNRLFATTTKLDKAIALSVAAMIGLNLFVLTEQLQADPTLQLAQYTAATPKA